MKLFKMNGCFLCIFGLFALPNGLAIICFKCEPDIPNTTCSSSDMKITNCDTDPDIPQGWKADACYKGSALMYRGGTNITSYAMGCGFKAKCGMFQKYVCNDSQAPLGMTFQKCTVTCCEQDRCNGIEDSTSLGKEMATSTSLFTAIIMSIAALYPGINI